MKTIDFKKVLWTLVAVSFGAFATSCKGDLEPSEKPDPVDDPEIITAVVEDSETKTSLVNTVKTVWNLNDTLLVCDSEGKTALFKCLEDGKAQASFEKVSGDSGFNFDKFEAAFYPGMRAEYDHTNKKFTYTAAQHQVYVEGTFAKNAAPMVSAYMVAKDGVKTMKFKNAFGVIRIPISGVDILSSIYLECYNSYYWGDFEISAKQNDGGTGTAAPEVSHVDETGGKYVYLDNCNVQLSDEAKYFHVVLPPTDTVTVLSDTLRVKISKIDVEKKVFKKDFVKYAQGSKIRIKGNTILNMGSVDVPYAPPGAVYGLYSINDTKQVWVSEGNLQYLAKGVEKDEKTHMKYEDKSWRFAPEQYHFYGTCVRDEQDGRFYEQMWYQYINTNNGCDYNGGNNYHNSPVNNDKRNENTQWIDLLTFGCTGVASNSRTYTGSYLYKGDSPYYGSKELGPDETGAGDINGTDYDWGNACEIYSGSSKVSPGTFRTLTVDEWKYLTNITTNTKRKDRIGTGCIILRRPDSKGVMYNIAVRGWILVPDNFIDPNVNKPVDTRGVSQGYSNFKACVYKNSENDWLRNVYFADNTWLRMEECGCVFIPMGSFINTTHSVDNGYNVRYWTANYHNSQNGDVVNLLSNAVLTDFHKSNACNVRLFMDNTADNRASTTPYVDGGDWTLAE